jgi:hypothetical protein
VECDLKKETDNLGTAAREMDKPRGPCHIPWLTSGKMFLKGRTGWDGTGRVLRIVSCGRKWWAESPSAPGVALPASPPFHPKVHGLHV